MQGLFVLFSLLWFGIQGTRAQLPIPDVYLGNPNELDNDALGPPITEAELLESLNVEILIPEEDPIGSSGFFEGDIMVKSRDILYDIVEGDPKGQNSAVKNPLLLWPNGVIPYVISSSFSKNQRVLIARGMKEFHDKTCIRFVPRTAEKDYVYILQGKGCSSSVGRAGGVQVLSLGSGCVYFGVILHELMHAAGFWHEQSRSDRDDYVTINWSAIIPGLRYNFNKNSNFVSTNLGLPYDYGSIMHYGPYSFTSRYGSPTIAAKKKGVTIGQRSGFSDLDVKSLNLLYKCPGAVRSTTTTPEPTPAPTDCIDLNTFCSSWASGGQCNSNPGYMRVNCKRSCNTCDTDVCGDIAGNCGSWSASGECERNPEFMKQSCRRACGFCESGGCVDENEYCFDWAAKGYCSSNPAYMNSCCKKSCGRCK
ncbi:LOW QUALITY PROTEIN: hatching enzyme 1.2-like [Palaemon carinicauda]|uniref:LOW QUALITY PROTEIN: hatching enzyme 1.2-like n=1 Tax=Palaemon carinicauda TaxID=392227 RepID=UPI0035B69676